MKRWKLKMLTAKLGQSASGGLLSAEPWKLVAVALGVLTMATLARQPSPLREAPCFPACPDRTHKLNGSCLWSYSVSSISSLSNAATRLRIHWDEVRCDLPQSRLHSEVLEWGTGGSLSPMYPHMGPCMPRRLRELQTPLLAR